MLDFDLYVPQYIFFLLCCIVITEMCFIYSVIKHLDGVVRIIPLGEAKTYVNGKCISDPTFLHHVS